MYALVISFVIGGSAGGMTTVQGFQSLEMCSKAAFEVRNNAIAAYGGEND